MLKVLILHGWHGSDLPHWQGWLAQQLVLENCIVAFPQFSDKMNPDKGVWIQEALDAIETLSPDVVVCHSLGNTLWFHLAKLLNQPVKKLLLCAPPRDLNDYREVSSFFPVELPSDLHATQVLMVVSDNDPYMSQEESISLAFKLNVPLKIIKSAGHINTLSGYGAWPWVKEWVVS
ncbi:MAG: alpha/beta hydrolase [Sulfuricurvum sp.]|jgi:hypothetical protein|uniref:RBBP9/YdeN family alpha/beta hydrolase n=1 Tax=Sulfuricurvum sp. TaxID=2025608 RepID=UPI0025EBD5EE|nr:alpha/beta hydrolase [Sulfuricurvum sp.]MCK9371888.1 alpha/beta hydrolase [Sulfuricurvum sp.]